MDFAALLRNVGPNDVINISDFVRQWDESSLNHQYHPSQTQVAFHLFGYYQLNKLNEAKFLWKRLPHEFKTENPQNAELIATWNLGKNLIKKDLIRAQKKINTTHWRDTAPLARMLRKKLQQDAKNMISKTYVSIQISKAAEMFGISETDLIPHVERWGWRIENGYVKPTQTTQTCKREVATDDIQVIGELVSYLEQKNNLV